MSIFSNAEGYRLLTRDTKVYRQHTKISVSICIGSYNRENESNLLLTFACATTLFAQRPGNPPDPATMVQHRVSSLATLLTLTASQQQQATTIFTNAATAESSVCTNLKAPHQTLSDAVKSDDLSTIDQTSTTIGNLMAQSVSTSAKARAAFYQILTPDQQAKFSQIQTQRPGRLRPGAGSVLEGGE